MEVLTALIGFGGTVITALCGVVSYLYVQMAKLQQGEVRCQRRLAVVSNQLVALQALIEQGATEAQVVVDANTGMIVEWSPAATMLLHWPQREIMGKRLTVIMPQRYREQHLHAVGEMVRTGRAPERGPIQGHALTKDGTEVPVDVYLSGWHAGPQSLIGARIRLREEEPAEAVEGETPAAP
jgi:PAS domain S-box-containing protein